MTKPLARGIVEMKSSTFVIILILTISFIHDLLKAFLNPESIINILN